MKKLTLWLLLIAVLIGACASCTGNKPDELKTKHLKMGVGAPLPSAADFVVDLPTGYTAKFAENYQFHSLGEYALCVIVTDDRGRSAEYTVQFTLVTDTEPPVLSGVQDISVCIGDGISYRGDVSLTDNCDGELTLEIDSAAVDNTKEGVYPVRYTATDAAGNRTEKEIFVYVYREKVTLQMLNAELDRVIAQKISVGASKETVAREVYDFVYYSIDYDNTSDKSDWVRAAYEGLRTGKGDCFTYFALSKALFERLGIKSMDIQRTAGIVDERHYWNFVNIGTDANPKWYHFDACRINGERDSLGKLMTDEQIDAFSRYRTDANGVSNYFYAYDRSRYPKTEQTIITKTDYD